MIPPHRIIPRVPVAHASYDPTSSASQVAFREISGDVPSSGEEIVVNAWAIAFQQHPQTRARYRKLVSMLGTVNALGYVPVKLDDVPGVMFSSMSERTDLMGEFTTIWVTSVDRGSGKRGATLACLNGTILHLIATDIYAAEDDDRAIYLLESLAEQIAARAPEMLMAHEVDEAKLIERLPTLNDFAGLLDDPQILSESYEENLR